MSRTREKYDLLLAIAFIGIGSWKAYGYFNGDENVASYQMYFSIALIGIGIFQLYRWWKKRSTPSDS